MLPLVKRRKKYALKMDLPDEDISKPLKYPPEIYGGGLANLPPLRAQIEVRKEIFLPENFEPRIAYFSVKKYHRILVHFQQNICLISFANL